MRGWRSSPSCPRSAKIIPATVSFVDIAGIVRGASEGQGLGNKFLAHIREADAICQVVRAFEDPDVTHVEGRVDPADDIATINTELILADLQTVDSRLPRLEREARMKPELRTAVAAVQAAREVLDSGRAISSEPTLDREALRELQLMTAKPFIYVFNVDEGELCRRRPDQGAHRLRRSRTGHRAVRQDRGRARRAR